MKKAICYLLVFVLILALAGCGQNNTDESTNPAGTESPPSEDVSTKTPDDAGSDTGDDPASYTGEVNLLTWQESEGIAYAEAFNKIYPNIKVNVVLADNGDVFGKLVSLAASGGDMPDVAYVEMNTRGQHLALDIWEDLSQAPYNFDGSALQDSLKEAITNAKGEVCVVEQNYNPSGMVYRRGLAEEYLGTDDPAEVASMISTWDDFCEIGAQIYEKSDGKVRALSGLDEINWMIDSQYTNNIADGTTLNLTEYFTYMFGIMTQLRDNNCVGKVNRWTNDWFASYNNGSVVFWQYAPWSASAAVKPSAEELSGDFSVIEAPGGPYYLGGTGWGIPQNAKNKEAAWLFVEFCLLNPDGISEAMQTLEMLTPLKGYYESNPDATQDDPFFNGQNVNQFLLDEISPDMNLRPTTEYDGTIKEVVSYVMGLIQDDPSMTTENAVSTALDEVKLLLPANVTVN